MPILRPGYVKWDGNKFVLDEDVEIVGPIGPPGPAGESSPSLPSGQISIELADEDYVISETENSFYIMKFTGTSTNLVTYPAPATDADSYVHVIRNQAGGSGITLTTGSETNLYVNPDGTVIAGFDPNGVFAITDIT